MPYFVGLASISHLTKPINMIVIVNARALNIEFLLVSGARWNQSPLVICLMGRGGAMASYETSACYR